MKTALAALAILASGAAFAADAPAEPRRSEIVNMVRQDCGSCHGLTMKGGLGPPLLPQSVAQKDPELMRAIILYGLRGTPMPPWRPFLSDDEAMFVVQLLKKGLPDAR